MTEPLDEHDDLLRPEVKQPKVAYDAMQLEAGPGLTAEAKSKNTPRAKRARDRSPDLSSRNVHGLRSKSETMYPEAYAPVNRTFWEGLSEQQQLEVMRLQAVAQEKVGYERGTQKYFMDDFDPHAVKKEDSGEKLVEIATPRIALAGAMMGAGAAIGVGLLSGALTGNDNMLVAAGLILAGAITLMFGSN